MKLTIFFAFVTCGLNQLGLAPMAEVTYCAASTAAFIQGSSAITGIVRSIRTGLPSTPVAFPAL